MRTVGPCLQDDHGVASVWHYQVQSIEREVWGDQCAVNLDSRAINAARPKPLIPGWIRAMRSVRAGRHDAVYRLGAARRLPPATDYTPFARTVQWGVQRGQRVATAADASAVTGAEHYDDRRE